MHYETALDDIIEHIKADKGIVQPWRNKAMARLEEAQAFIRMGLTTTYRQGPNLVRGSGPEIDPGFYKIAGCTCPNGATDKNCPMHGSNT